MDEQRRVQLGEDLGGFDRLLGGYLEIPTYNALPWRTAVSSAPMVSLRGVSGSKRWE